jgi:hypothetical protein
LGEGSGLVVVLKQKVFKVFFLLRGFRVFGRRELIEVAGVWRDTLLLERRSGVVGV